MAPSPSAATCSASSHDARTKRPLRRTRGNVRRSPGPGKAEFSSWRCMDAVRVIIASLLLPTCPALSHGKTAHKGSVTTSSSHTYTAFALGAMAPFPLGWHQAAVSPLMVDEGLCRLQLDGNDFSDENDVIAAVVAEPRAAFHLAPRVVQQRSPRFPHRVLQLSKPVGVGHGEPIGQLLLIVPQGADTKPFRRLEVLKA